MKTPGLSRSMPAVAFAALWSAGAWPAAQAADFAPVGTRATLSVEYRFESRGQDAPSQDGVYKERGWQVKREATVTAELEARKPQPMPSLQAPEAGQVARLQQQGAQMQQASRQMAPMMADAQAVVARCGDDEKCIEREVMKMGAGLAGTQQLADAQRTGRETAAATQPGADRYQRWQGRTQTARYTIEERWHVLHADPICMTLPGKVCTHDLARTGAGDLAAAPSPAQVEVDTQASTLTVQLPVPHGVLPTLETHSTNEPAGTHSTATPSGPQKAQTALRVTADGKAGGPPITVALKGGWRSQSGEQVIPMGAGGWHGASGDGGKLVVRWRFSVQ